MGDVVKQRITQLILVYLIAFAVIIALSSIASAEESSVDIVSKDAKTDLIKITIDRCVTVIEVKKNDLYSLSNDDSSIKNAVMLASLRAKSGCK